MNRFFRVFFLSVTGRGTRWSFINRNASRSPRTQVPSEGRSSNPKSTVKEKSKTLEHTHTHRHTQKTATKTLMGVSFDHRLRAKMELPALSLGRAYQETYTISVLISSSPTIRLSPPSIIQAVFVLLKARISWKPSSSIRLLDPSKGDSIALKIGALQVRNFLVDSSSENPNRVSYNPRVEADPLRAAK